MQRRKISDLNNPYIDSPELIRELQRKLINKKKKAEKNSGKTSGKTPHFIRNKTNKNDCSYDSIINSNIIDTKMVQNKRKEINENDANNENETSEIVLGDKIASKNITNYSFSTKDTRDVTLIKKKNVEFLKYNLTENKKRGSLFHRFLPKKYRNNEKYKEKLIKFIKSENKIKFNNEKIHSKPLKNILNIKENICWGDCCLKSKIPSVRILSSNKIENYDKNNKIYVFNLYKDSEIGMEKKWRDKLIYFSDQEDIDSTESVIANAIEAVEDNINKGIEEYKDNILNN